jgi:hypothetical protein
VSQPAAYHRRSFAGRSCWPAGSPGASRVRHDSCVCAAQQRLRKSTRAYRRRLLRQAPKHLGKSLGFASNSGTRGSGQERTTHPSSTSLAE